LDGENWTGLNTFTTKGTAVSFNKSSAFGLYLAGGDSPNMAYSYNGVSWTSNNTGILTGSYTTSIEWVGDRWLAVSGDTSLATSYNGISWAGSTLPTSAVCVGWSDSTKANVKIIDRMVAAGQGTNTLAISDNGGKVWKPLGSSIFTSDASDVIWGGDKFVAMGYGGNSIAYSEDGQDWTGLGTSIFSSGGNSVNWNGQRYYAVGNGTANTLASSPDGINWTGRGTTIFDNGTDIAWNGNRYVAVGSSTNTIAYSATNLYPIYARLGTSTIPNSPVAQGNIVRIGNVLYNLVDGTPSSLYKFEIGVDINWVNTNNDYPLNIFTTHMVAYGNYLVAIGGQIIPYPTLTNKGYYIDTQNTSYGWLPLPDFPFAFHQAGFCVYQDQFYIVGGNTSGAGISAVNTVYRFTLDTLDNGSWTQVALLPEAIRFCAVTSDSNYAYIVGGQKTDGSYVSTFGKVDNASYTSINKNYPINITQSAAFIKNDILMVFGGSNSMGYTSNCYAINLDNISAGWTLSIVQNLPSAFNPLPYVIDNGDSIDIQKYYDGSSTFTNWIRYDFRQTYWTGIGASIFSVLGRGVEWCGDKWVAVGQGTNTIAISSDGVSWTGLGSSIFSTWGRRLAYNGKIIVAVGSGTNTIAYSYDGLVWTGLGTGVFSTAGADIKWTGKYFIATGFSTNTMAISYNGITWTGLSNPFTTSGYGISNPSNVINANQGDTIQTTSNVTLELI
jgi:hypothetical protein